MNIKSMGVKLTRIVKRGEEEQLNVNISVVTKRF